MRLGETNLIGIMGKAGAGKDTLAFLLKERGWQHKAFSEALKKICSIILGEDVEKFNDRKFKESNLLYKNIHSVRGLLQHVGMLLRKEVDENVWIDILFSDYHPNNKWVISDVRLPNEVETIKRNKGIIIKIVRPELEQEVIDRTHISETALDNYIPDYIIINDGSIQDLSKKISEIY